jgi:hypothetical protein
MKFSLAQKSGAFYNLTPSLKVNVLFIPIFIKTSFVMDQSNWLIATKKKNLEIGSYVKYETHPIACTILFPPNNT